MTPDLESRIHTMRLTETNVVAPKIRVKKIGKVHTVVKVCVFHEAELLTVPESCVL
jgi:hypothetical protein